MKPIRVAIAQSRNDVLARVIADALLKSAEFEIVGDHIVHIDNVDPLLSSARQVDALVVVGERGGMVPEDVLARHPGIIVSHIVIGSKAIRFDMSDVDVGGLLSTLSTLARNRGNAPRTLNFQVVPGSSENGHAECGVVPIPTYSEAMKLALAWINVVLLHHNERFPLGEGDVPGLARNTASIRRSLTATPPPPESPAIAAAEAKLLDALDKSETDADPLVRLYRNLGLSPLELKFFLISLAPDVDARFHAVMGTFNDDMGRRSPTFALAAAMLGDPSEVRAALAHSGALTRWHLLDCGEQFPRGDDAVRVDAALATWLLGECDALTNDTPVRISACSQAWRGVALLEHEFDHELASTLAGVLQPAERSGRWLVLGGSDSDGWRALVELAAQVSRLPLLRISLGMLATAPADVARGAVARLARTAMLLGAAPVIDAQIGDADHDYDSVMAALMHAMAGMPQGIAVISKDARRFVGLLRGRVAAVFDREAPVAQAVASRFWIAAAQSGVSLSPEDCARLGHVFALPLGDIEDSVRLAALQGAAEAPQERQYAMVAAACRHVASPEMPRFAKRIIPTFKLDDIVLPAEWQGQLHEIVHNVVHDAQVMNDWGFATNLPQGRGVACLFHGPSGTGKTTAAQAVASALNTDVCQIDLSLLESKYIGDTAKHVDAVFSDAEKSRCVLCCDEADAVLGRRSEIKDAHDRYANIDVAYLLQRIEAYSGLVILTTNFRQNIDQAFLRRFRFVVEFPKPDAAAREQIWDKCLPASAPIAADVDLGFLALRVELTGGNIRQITLRAAFSAAAEGSPEIAMRHILAATRAELIKAEMMSAVHELEEFDASRRRNLRQVA